MCEVCREHEKYAALVRDAAARIPERATELLELAEWIERHKDEFVDQRVEAEDHG